MSAQEMRVMGTQNTGMGIPGSQSQEHQSSSCATKVYERTVRGRGPENFENEGTGQWLSFPEKAELKGRVFVDGLEKDSPLIDRIVEKVAGQEMSEENFQGVVEREISRYSGFVSRSKVTSGFKKQATVHEAFCMKDLKDETGEKIRNAVKGSQSLQPCLDAVKNANGCHIEERKGLLYVRSDSRIFRFLPPFLTSAGQAKWEFIEKFKLIKAEIVGKFPNIPEEKIEDEIKLCLKGKLIEFSSDHVKV